MDKSRREFLKGMAWMGVAAMAAGHLAAQAAENRPGCAAGAPMHGFRVAPMKRVRVGFIGVGARGTPAVKRILGHQPRAPRRGPEVDEGERLPRP